MCQKIFFFLLRVRLMTAMIILWRWNRGLSKRVNWKWSTVRYWPTRTVESQSVKLTLLTSFLLRHWFIHILGVCRSFTEDQLLFLWDLPGLWWWLKAVNKKPWNCQSFNFCRCQKDSHTSPS